MAFTKGCFGQIFFSFFQTKISKADIPKVYKNDKKEEEPSLRWKIDWLLFNAVSAISQSIKGGQQIKQKTLSERKVIYQK